MKYQDYQGCNIKWINEVYPRVILSAKQYEVCVAQSSNMECSNNSGIWGKGLVNTDNDPYKVERTGYLGEVAFGALWNFPAFLGRKKGGDIDDFVINNMKIDIKATARWGSMLIKSVSEYKNQVNLKSDIYVSAFLEEYIEQKKARVCFIGYATGDFVRNMPDVKAIKGKHFNKEIPWKKLLPMGGLKQALQL